MWGGPGPVNPNDPRLSPVIDNFGNRPLGQLFGGSSRPGKGPAPAGGQSPAPGAGASPAPAPAPTGINPPPGMGPFPAQRGPYGTPQLGIGGAAGQLTNPAMDRFGAAGFPGGGLTSVGGILMPSAWFTPKSPFHPGGGNKEPAAPAAKGPIGRPQNDRDRSQAKDNARDRADRAARDRADRAASADRASASRDATADRRGT